METSIVPCANWKCWIAGKFNHSVCVWKIVKTFIDKKLFQFGTFRTPKKSIQSVPMERCKQRLSRCKKLAACNKERLAGIVKPSKSDYLCGTDSKTYKSECDLAQATCLWVQFKSCSFSFSNSVCQTNTENVTCNPCMKQRRRKKTI